MSPVQAYLAMFKLLNSIWADRKSEFHEDFIDLLSSMSMAKDSRPIDFRLWEIWNECLGQKSDVSEEEAFSCITCFLDSYRNIGEGGATEITKVTSLINTQYTAEHMTWLQFVEDVKEYME